ncbi:hypothetical protein BD410DRAFT_515791 [Rickenella mellea]|uniref:Uncharacterized protein n=1 Tax=Rickenella mellea TaxID=50990 RepID=A0A4Y7PTS6_9AGAM|nr:hypothetical protein BD410DRAFT_515791 [Rickenella mellea]
MDGRHFDRLLGIPESKDKIRSLYISPSCPCTFDDFPWILAGMPKLETFSYDIDVDIKQQSRYSSTWLGVGRHASLTHIHLFRRIDDAYLRRRGSFSAIKDFFLVHLQPLMASHPPPTIGIVDAGFVFEHGDLQDDGYGATSKQRFFGDLSRSLTSAEVQVIVKLPQSRTWFMISQPTIADTSLWGGVLTISLIYPFDDIRPCPPNACFY